MDAAKLALVLRCQDATVLELFRLFGLVRTGRGVSEAFTRIWVAFTQARLCEP